jgi:hypothetical protein
MEYRKENLKMMGEMLLHSGNEASDSNLFTRGFGKSTKSGRLFNKAVSESGTTGALDSFV